MRILLMAAVLFGMAFGITEEEFRKDREYVSRVEKRLEKIDRQAVKGVSTEMIDELNSYGYPLHLLERKYLTAKEKRFEEFYERVRRVSEKLLYVKRGILPVLLRREFKEVKAHVCNVRAEGKRRETITVVMEDPDNEREVLKVVTKTQLRYAHLLGIENIKFEKCK